MSNTTDFDKKIGGMIPEEKTIVKILPDDSEKIVTFLLKGPMGTVIGRDLISLIELIFGDPKTIDDMYQDLPDGDEIHYSLIVERKYTAEELDAMPEGDSDIH